METKWIDSKFLENLKVRCKNCSKWFLLKCVGCPSCGQKQEVVFKFWRSQLAADG
jgi:hypothetical protein